MKKIIIALDYTPAAEKVAEKGYEIANALNAEITLVHVITEPSYYAMEYAPIMGYRGGYTDATIDVVKDIKKSAADFLNASVKHLGDDAIKTAVLEGDTEDAILDYCNSIEADMIIMGSHKHKGLERLLVADLAAHILRHSKIPLLTIPTEDAHAGN